MIHRARVSVLVGLLSVGCGGQVPQEPPVAPSPPAVPVAPIAASTAPPPATPAPIASSVAPARNPYPSVCEGPHVDGQQAARTCLCAGDRRGVGIGVASPKEYPCPDALPDASALSVSVTAPPSSPSGADVPLTVVLTNRSAGIVAFRVPELPTGVGGMQRLPFTVTDPSGADVPETQPLCRQFGASPSDYGPRTAVVALPPGGEMTWSFVWHSRIHTRTTVAVAPSTKPSTLKWGTPESHTCVDADKTLAPGSYTVQVHAPVRPAALGDALVGKATVVLAQ